MTRLKKIANNNQQLGQYIVDIINDDIVPNVTRLNNSGYGYGYDEVVRIINDIIWEYNFVSKKAQEMDALTDISWYCRDSIQKCEKCKDELKRWYEDYSSMPTDTQDQKYEKAEYEYQADKMICDVMEALLVNHKNIENEVANIEN